VLIVARMTPFLSLRQLGIRRIGESIPKRFGSHLNRDNMTVHALSCAAC
jgi:hypothetical protein